MKALRLVIGLSKERRFDSNDSITLFVLCLFVGFNLLVCAESVTTNSKTKSVASPPLTSQHAEEVRCHSLLGRRLVCGKILNVLSDGLVVESAYTNLLRAPLGKSWLLPGTVAASRPSNLVEGKEPGCVAVGLVFLTGLPKSHSEKPRQYDYVVVQGYPAGQYTYTSVADVKRTVRRFATTLPNAVQLNLLSEQPVNNVPLPARRAADSAHEPNNNKM